jgi:Na+/proline symporter
MPPTRSFWRLAELLAMFALAPTVLALVMQGWMVFPAIWLLAAIALVLLWRDPTFDRRELVRLGSLREALPGMAVRIVAAAVALAGVLWLWRPEWVLGLPRERPRIWALIMVFYPVLSVYPQELAFRAFFRHRYRGLFRTRWAFVVVNAAAFGYAHVIMHNAVAVVLSFVGGLALAHAYEKHRSTPAAWLEHSLYGCAAFTIGWGRLFYGGAIGR